MTKKNPFVLMGYIPDEYFCDRVVETEKLTHYITGQSTNILLMSERRLGKTGLITHCFEQPEVANDFYTFYFDILHTSSLAEFTYELGKELYSRLIPRGQQMLQSLSQTVRSLNPRFSMDPLSGAPTFSLEIGSITQPEYTLDEIFAWLEHADKPCIIAIDEFQRIAKYQEKNVEALLRGKIQRLSNCHFIFSGSQRHLLTEMFQTYKRPFYNSTMPLSLDRIEMDIYAEFAMRLFRENDRTLEQDTFERLYRCFGGNTFCVQKMLHLGFDAIGEGETCSCQVLQQCLRDTLADSEHGYRETLSRMTVKQKAVLTAIALEGEADKITSGAFLRRHNLESASMVQTAVRVLLDEEWIGIREKKYYVSDTFFAFWLRMLAGEEIKI